MMMNSVGRYLRHGRMELLSAIECGGVVLSGLALDNKQRESEVLL